MRNRLTLQDRSARAREAPMKFCRLCKCNWGVGVWVLTCTMVLSMQLKCIGTSTRTHAHIIHSNKSLNTSQLPDFYSFQLWLNYCFLPSFLRYFDRLSWKPLFSFSISLTLGKSSKKCFNFLTIESSQFTRLHKHTSHSPFSIFSFYRPFYNLQEHS